LLAPVDRNCLPPDLRDWLNLCESGGLYREVAEMYSLGDSDRDKETIKRFLFKTVMFGSTPRSGSKRWADYRKFAGRFPTIEGYLRRMKAMSPGLQLAFKEGRCSEHQRDRWARGRPARLSQRMEALLMIDLTVGRLRREHPEIPLVTCHDSILTTRGYIELVASEIKSTFMQIGLDPTIKIGHPREESTE